MPRSREEIIEKFQACAEQIGKTPGEAAFAKLTGIKPWEVRYYWPTFAALCRVDFITRALMRIVADSIERRCRFSLLDFDQMLFGNKIISE